MSARAASTCPEARGETLIIGDQAPRSPAAGVPVRKNVCTGMTPVHPEAIRLLALCETKSLPRYHRNGPARGVAWVFGHCSSRPNHAADLDAPAAPSLQTWLNKQGVRLDAHGPAGLPPAR